MGERKRICILEQYKIRVIRSKRKSVALEVSQDLCVIVRVPLRFPDTEINKLISRHEEWIKKAIEKRRERANKYPQPTDEEIKALYEKAEKIIPPRVKYYSELTGLTPTGIKITGAKKRFGSCSGKNSLCFSYLLVRYPDAAIDYVVLHEIAHIKHHNHSKDFYALVRQYMPDYKEREKLLKS